ncbi:MAG: dockerin type I repeat-containing protein, partial [Bryobacteraceae bacterium]
CNCAPPDTNGYVGLTQYVQIVNEGYQVFDKFTGVSTLGPASIKSVWAGFGGICQTGGSGDPIMLYDKLADRWVISQFAVGGAAPDHECVAVSTTSDATGPYYRYDFNEVAFGNNFYDYPKIGTWPDAYYMSANVFNSSGTAYLGTQAFALERNKMLCGLPAAIISPGLVGLPANNNDPVMPADFDGTVLPPPGAPNTFVEFPDSTGNNLNTYRLWHFGVGSPFGTGMTFTQVASPAAAPFTFLTANVPQLPPQTSLDNLADRLMFRFAYRNYGTPSVPDESAVANYSVSSGGVAGVRWFELKNVTNGPVTVHQESTYQPDTTWRWMGSVAMDHSRNLAVGFSASDATINPQIRYAVELFPTINTLSGETHLFDGTGSQSGTNSRWGDYSAMTVDPTDDTTMWYTQEYYATNSSFNWRTRIGSFRMDPNQALVNVSVKSRLTQGAAGPFDLNLPLYAGTSGPGRAVESRNAASYIIVFNFTNPTSGVDPTVTSSCGTATAAIGSDPRQVLATFSGACNGQYITLQLNNVTDGTTTISPSVTFGLLVGDTSGNGNVNGADVSQAKSQSGIAACPPNFRLDVNGDGVIDATDVSLVKSKSGTALPTSP